MTSEEKHNMENVSLSDCQIEQLAKALLKPCMDLYSDPENIKDMKNGKQKENKSNI